MRTSARRRRRKPGPAGGYRSTVPTSTVPRVQVPVVMQSCKPDHCALVGAAIPPVSSREAPGGSRVLAYLLAYGIAPPHGCALRLRQNLSIASTGSSFHVSKIASRAFRFLVVPPPRKAAIAPRCWSSDGSSSDGQRTCATWTRHRRRQYLPRSKPVVAVVSAVVARLDGAVVLRVLIQHLECRAPREASDARPAEERVEVVTKPALRVLRTARERP